MGESRGNSDFEIEQLTKTYVRRQIWTNNLDRDRHIEDDVARAENAAHAAFTEHRIGIEPIPLWKLIIQRRRSNSGGPGAGPGDRETA